MKQTVAFLCLLSLCVFPVVIHGQAWTVATTLPTRRSDLTCSLYGTGIITMGGCSSDEVYEENYSACATISSRVDVYYPDTNSWDSTTLPAMPRPRARHGAAIVSDKLYVFGGRDVNDTIIQEVDVLDLQAKTWSTLPAPYANSTSDFAIFVIDNVIIMVGGYNQDYSQAYSYTSLFFPNNNTFEVNVAQMRAGRGDICGVTLNGKGHVVGGFLQNDYCEPNNNVEQFDLASRRWLEESVTLTKIDGGDVACTSFVDKILVLGGEGKVTEGQYCFSSPLRFGELFNFNTDVFDYLPDIPEARFRFCAATYGGKPYFFGGQGPLESKNGQHIHQITANVYTVYVPPQATGAALQISLFVTLSFALLVSLFNF